MNNQSAIIIGKVIATHGIKGWVVIQSYSYPSENICNYDTFLCIDNERRYINILELKMMPKKIIVQLQDFNDINLSESILGQNIFINASDIPVLKKGEYYWRELEGLQVYTSKNDYLGSVDFIFNNGANDILAIKHNKEYIYVPFISDYTEVIPNKKIIINHETI